MEYILSKIISRPKNDRTNEEAIKSPKGNNTPTQQQQQQQQTPPTSNRSSIDNGGNSDSNLVCAEPSFDLTFNHKLPSSNGDEQLSSTFVQKTQIPYDKGTPILSPNTTADDKNSEFVSPPLLSNADVLPDENRVINTTFDGLALPDIVNELRTFGLSQNDSLGPITSGLGGLSLSTPKRGGTGHEANIRNQFFLHNDSLLSSDDETFAECHSSNQSLANQSVPVLNTTRDVSMCPITPSILINVSDEKMQIDDDQENLDTVAVQTPATDLTTGLENLETVAVQTQATDLTAASENLETVTVQTPATDLTTGLEDDSALAHAGSEELVPVETEDTVTVTGNRTIAFSPRSSSIDNVADDFSDFPLPMESPLDSLDSAPGITPETVNSVNLEQIEAVRVNESSSDEQILVDIVPTAIGEINLANLSSQMLPNVTSADDFDSSGDSTTVTQSIVPTIAEDSPAVNPMPIVCDSVVEDSVDMLTQCITGEIDVTFKTPALPQPSKRRSDGPAVISETAAAAAAASASEAAVAAATAIEPTVVTSSIPSEFAQCCDDMNFQPSAGYVFSTSDFDFLLTKGANHIAPDRNSLLLRFDPLSGQSVPVNQQNFVHDIVTSTVIDRRLPATAEEEAEIINFTADNCTNPFDEQSNAYGDVSESIAVPVLSELNQLPSSLSLSPSVVDVPAEKETTAPETLIAVVATDTVTTVAANVATAFHTAQLASGDATMNDVLLDVIKEMKVEKIDYKCSDINKSPKEEKHARMAELEKKIKNETLKTEDIEKKLAEAEQREDALIKRITEKDKTIAKMSDVMKAYEKAIAELIAEKEQTAQSFDKKCANLQLDRDMNAKHLNSLEATFSDLHAKYERSKQITADLKQAEEILLEEKKHNLENLRLQEQRYEKMKNHAMQQLEIANAKLDSVIKNHSQETTKLKALLKKEEISRSSISEQLQQKSRENEELVKICDELINGGS